MHMQAQPAQVVPIPLKEIFCDDDFNCRGSIAPIDVEDLLKSIRDVGLKQPIVVQPWDQTPGKKYRIVMGHRRYIATTLIPEANTINAMVEDNLTELQARKLNLVENLNRKDLNILQEAKAITPFLKAGWQQQKIANELKQSRGWVQARLNLLRLPEAIQQDAAAGFLNQEQIRQVSELKTLDQKFEAVREIKESKLRQDKRKFDVSGKKKNPLSKRRRDRAEIFEMNDVIMDVVGPCFATRCLSWSAGEINDYELYQSLKEYADLLQIPYDIPPDLKDRVTAAAYRSLVE